MRRIIYACGGILLIAAMMLGSGAVPMAIYALAALLHEAGHILAAKLQGINIKRISLGVLGLKIETDERLFSYKSELILALSGPLANLASLAVILVIARACGVPIPNLIERSAQMLQTGHSEAWGYVGFFALSSLIHAATNLMPIKSFDGGRATRCAAALLFGERAAEIILTVTSVSLLFAIWSIALYLMLKISSGIGIYAFVLSVFLTTLHGERRKN